MTPSDLSTLPLLPLLPLLSFTILILVGRRIPKGDWLATAFMGLGLLLAVVLFAKTVALGDPDFSMPASASGLGVDWLATSAPAGAGASTFFAVKAGILFDNLTAVMLVVVTLVSFLVHLYSMGYMHGDPLYSRYYAYLGIFSFSMLGLVLADNLLFLYIFWELVGLSSYLLIGFWFHKPSAAYASKKAFLANRVGDFGFLLGLLLLYRQTGTLTFDGIFQAIADGAIGGETLTVAGICIFMGAVGKSAQFPLHVWLPDAMEGPTPVSALIHAATMVAAGVYMVGRLYPVFSPTALLVIAIVGAITAFLAAAIGIVQHDIKKVLAYSTVSQLGYMILALGVGGYMSGLFHLTTHACFKALLFLGAGSVIHAMHHEQDMRAMGGLRKKLPVTFWTMLIATLALSGFPGLSGHYSKDAILADSIVKFSEGGLWRLPAIAAVSAAAITAFYMFRLIFLTFFGRPRNAERYDHAHESPLTMTIPLVVLAVLSLGAGWGGWFQNWIRHPAGEAARAAMAVQAAAAGTHQAAPAGAAGAHEAEGHVPPASAGAALAGDAAHVANPEEEPEAGHEAGHDARHEAAHGLAVRLGSAAMLLGFLLAFATYFRDWISAEAWARRLRPLYVLLCKKYYFDEFYEQVLVKILLAWNRGLALFDQWVVDGLVNASAVLARILAGLQGAIDRHLVDGLVNGVAQVCQLWGRLARVFQTGNLGTYLSWLVAGSLGLIVVVILFA